MNYYVCHDTLPEGSRDIPDFSEWEVVEADSPRMAVDAFIRQRCEGLEFVPDELVAVPKFMVIAQRDRKGMAPDDGRTATPNGWLSPCVVHTFTVSFTPAKDAQAAA